MLLILLATLAAEDGGVIIEPGGEVRSAEVAPPQLKPLPRTPLTLEFQQLDVRVVLEFLAKSGNQNIVVADGVSGSVTLLVVDRPWDECLSMVLLGAGLQAQRMGDALIVVSPLPR